MSGAGRTAIAVDLTSPEDQHRLREVLGRADMLMKGSRPGTMEKFGLGPGDYMEENPGGLSTAGSVAGVRMAPWHVRPGTTSTT